MANKILQIDLFENYKKQSTELKKIVNKYSRLYESGDMDYNDTKKFLKDVNSIGYTFDYGLDNMPYGLRPIGVKIYELKGFENVEEEEFAGGGGVKKQNPPQSKSYTKKNDIQAGKAKPVGKRYTDKLAKKLGKSPNAEPTQKDINKYLGKGVYDEKRKDKSDISLRKKFDIGGTALPDVELILELDNESDFNLVNEEIGFLFQAVNPAKFDGRYELIASFTEVSDIDEYDSNDKIDEFEAGIVAELKELGVENYYFSREVINYEEGGLSYANGGGVDYTDYKSLLAEERRLYAEYNKVKADYDREYKEGEFDSLLAQEYKQKMEMLEGKMMEVNNDLLYLQTHGIEKSFGGERMANGGGVEGKISQIRKKYPRVSVVKSVSGDYIEVFSKNQNTIYKIQNEFGGDIDHDTEMDTYMLAITTKYANGGGVGDFGGDLKVGDIVSTPKFNNGKIIKINTFNEDEEIQGKLLKKGEGLFIVQNLDIDNESDLYWFFSNELTKKSGEISKNQLENMVGKKLDGWNDDVVYYNGKKYQKCYLRPYYKVC